MENLLNLLEPVVFRVDPEGRVVAGNRAAASMLAGKEGFPGLLRELFGVDTPAELAARIEAPVTAGPRGVRWDVQPLPGGELLAVGVDWVSAGELLDRLTKETLLYKEIILNVVPRFVVDELVQRKAIQPKAYLDSTILFFDVDGFGALTGEFDPVALVRRLAHYFALFDRITGAFGVEKIKTIGDAYMAVSGIPHRRPGHAVDAVLAALRIQHDLRLPEAPQHGTAHGPHDAVPWRFRVGLHSGPCISGVLGASRFLFDVWGKTVRVAAAVQESGAPGEVTVSGATWDLVQGYFEGRSRGEARARDEAPVATCSVSRLRPELAADAAGLEPGGRFLERYRADFLECPGAPAAAPLPPYLASL